MGRIQKRMGYALLQFKKGMKGQQLEDGKGVGGAGRLTRDTIKNFKITMALPLGKIKVTCKV